MSLVVASETPDLSRKLFDSYDYVYGSLRYLEKLNVTYFSSRLRGPTDVFVSNGNER